MVFNSINRIYVAFLDFYITMCGGRRPKPFLFILIHVMSLNKIRYALRHRSIFIDYANDDLALPDFILGYNPVIKNKHKIYNENLITRAESQCHVNNHILLSNSM